MAQYNQIKRPADPKAGHGHSGDDLNPLAETLADRWPMVAAGVGAAILVAAAVYGGFYYTETRAAEAHVGLYKARSVVPATGASAAQADAGIDALNALVAKGGPGPVMAQAYLELAALNWRAGRYQEAYDEYGMAKGAAEDPTVATLADVGRANALFRMERYDEAATLFSVTADNAGSYPKGPLFYGLALAQAMAGKKDAAIGALTRLKNETPDYLPADVVDDLSRRIDADEFASIEPVAAPAAPATGAPGAPGGSSGLEVHTGQ